MYMSGKQGTSSSKQQIRKSHSKHTVSASSLRQKNQQYQTLNEHRDSKLISNQSLHSQKTHQTIQEQDAFSEDQFHISRQSITSASFMIDEHARQRLDQVSKALGGGQIKKLQPLF